MPPADPDPTSPTEVDDGSAAQGLAHNLVVVTDNVREFRRVRGLKVENWRA